MNRRLEMIRDQLTKKEGQREEIQKNLAETREIVEEMIKRREDISEALEIIQVSAKVTQQELEVHVSDLTTLALSAVFPEPYKLELGFELRRNRSEADLLLVDQDGNKVSPMDSVGGGVVDVAALALRISLWTLKRPRPRAVIIMDEPCRFVSRDLQERAFKMIGEVSKKLGIQFIIVTHEEELVGAADKVFAVSKRKGKSIVKVV